MNYGTGSGFGKTILFGEHFVVHNLPGIVAALHETLDAKVTQSTENKLVLVDETIKFKNNKLKRFTTEMALPRINAILNYLKIDTPLHITISGTLKIANSGMGASAANVVAFVKALNSLFNLHLTPEQIRLASDEGEKIAHGKPSGIDVAAATYGGVFIFKSSEEQPLLITISIKKPIEIVLAESGAVTKTPLVIEAVQKLKKEQPKLVQNIFNKYKTLVASAHTALTNFNLKTVGELMNQNHELLQQLKVSCPQLNDMVNIARNAGAYGAKLTGTGRGGLIVALTPGKDLQNHVADALEQQGFETLKTVIR